jgi:hypothetical protein
MTSGAVGWAAVVAMMVKIWTTDGWAMVHLGCVEVKVEATTEVEAGDTLVVKTEAIVAGAMVCRKKCKVVAEMGTVEVVVVVVVMLVSMAG